MRGLPARLQAEGTQEPHDRRKARVSLICVGLGHRIRATERQQALQLRSVRSDYIVEQIPCHHPERLALVEVLVEVGRLVIGKRQQALVYHGKRVGHRPPLALRHLDVIVALGLPFIRRTNYRRQMSLRIDHLQRDHSVEPDRPIVGFVLMRLNERDGNVHVRRHRSGYRQSEARTA